MKKSVSKRIRITATGKMMRRPMGVNHFRTRKSNRLVRSKRKRIELNYPKRKIVNY
ncbi:MAG: 50S ribosomal protein L35 [bacterium]|nr:50S ribosomal protein L35 [bacterium]